MILQSIPRSEIKIPKPDPKFRTFDKEHAASIAESIREHGLLNPPLVRPIKHEEYKYEVVHGRQRTYAMGKILGWDEIPCYVDDAGRYADDREAEIAALIENIQHAPLTPAQYYASLARWKAAFEELHPNATGTGSHLREKLGRLADAAKAAAEEYVRAKAAADAAKETGDDQVIEEATKTEEAAKAKAEDTAKAVKSKETMKVKGQKSTFVDEAAKVTGKKRSQVYEDSRVSERLTPEQIEALTLKGITKAGLQDLARIPDPDARSKAVDLACSGLTLDEAILEACKGAKPVPKITGKAGKAAAKARPDTKVVEPSADSFPDDEWLSTYCKDVWGLIKKKSAFKRDALLYRHTYEARKKAQNAIKKALQACGGDGISPYYNVLYRFAFTKHPSEWKVCGTCSGTGKDKETGKECNTCKGSAFRTEVEYH
jgi:ParB family chromosome partitioning protein